MPKHIFYKEVTGNLEKADQSCKLWIQSYPRAAMPHTYLAGAIYPAKGRYDGVISEAREAIRLEPDVSASYAFLIYGYIAQNRFDEANATYRQALNASCTAFSSLSPSIRLPFCGTMQRG